MSTATLLNILGIWTLAAAGIQLGTLWIMKLSILPMLNAREIEELPEEVRRGIRFHPVETMDQVLALALASPPAQLVDDDAAVAARPTAH